MHKVGTMPRLAMELMLWTGQRRSDVIRMGRQHVRDVQIRVNQQKTGKDLWIKIAPQLQAAIDAMPAAHMTFLATEYGRPFSPAGFGNRFRDWCDKAGLQHCTAHGLRKAIATRMAELGLSNQSIKSVGGWSGDSEVNIYTRAAEQRRLADAAIDQVSGWEMSNRDDGLDKRRRK